MRFSSSATARTPPYDSCVLAPSDLSRCSMTWEMREITSGEIWFRRRDGKEHDLAKVDPEGGLIRSIRGNEIAMIFQEPMTSLSPMHTIGEQIVEAITLHQNISKEEAGSSATRFSISAVL